MKERKMAWLLSGVLAVGPVALAGCGTDPADEAGVAAESAEVQVDPAAQRLERLSGLEVPPDGQGLGDFMLREIPDVIAEVPCVCCNKKLTACYQGDCPPL